MPAHLAIVDETWSTGHNVVVDGNNTDDYYHLNFGWGGSYNGWYLLPEEIPYNLTVVEGVVVDIMKKISTGIVIQEKVIETISFYPNPVDDIAYLNYCLKERGSVFISIYDQAGKIIRKDEYMNQMPGQYSVSVSIEDQPPGFYFYSLHIGNHVFSGKIISIK